MTKRYTDFLIEQTIDRVSLGRALSKRFKQGYNLADFRKDIFAGAVVALVALPLAMALSIASGVSPAHGVFTVIIAGFFVALLGGSQFQVTGPTAAFVVILAPIAQDFGLQGLLIAGLMAGVLLFIMGLARLGKLIQFIPHPVTTGFTSGIALVLATIQLKEFLGLSEPSVSETYLERLHYLVVNLPAISWGDFGIGIGTLAILVFWSRLKIAIPAPLIAFIVASIAAAAVSYYFPTLSISTIANRFGDPQFLLTMDWPWNFVEGNTSAISFSSIRALLPSAFAIAVLGAIESLLSATIADGMTQTKHDPDTELMALGIGNILCPFFGGIAATGAIARTATNIRFGATSPIAAMSHAVFALLAIYLISGWIGYLPMASLAALLLLVAYNISEVRHFAHITKVAPRSDVLVLWTCFLLTVLFDMVVGVTVGVMLAALLFMKRMAALTSSRVTQGEEYANQKLEVPKDVIVYEIVGPMFFGAAENAVGALRGIGSQVRAIIFVLERVPLMDVTGLVAFESTVNRFLTEGKSIYVVGLAPQPRELLANAGILSKANLKTCDTLASAVQAVRQETENA